MSKDHSEFIIREEHDPEFRVKKTSNYQSDGNGSLVREIANGFRIGEYDYIALTYVAAGNGAGEIETVVYKTGGSGGTTLGTLTLTYDASNNIADITFV